MNSDVDDFCAQALVDWNVPGMGLAVVRAGKVVWAKGYGYRDQGAKLPFTPDTLFPIASNTKLFTAIAAGLLVEQGLLDWDRRDPRGRAVHPLFERCIEQHSQSA